MHRIAFLAFLILIGVLVVLVWPAGPSVSSCVEITSPGEYFLSNNITDPPTIGASPLSGQACIKITSNDVVLDCKDYGISFGPSDFDNYGILLTNVRNVVVQNCHISGYKNGVYVYQSSENFFYNNTAETTPDNRGVGFYSVDSNSNKYEHNNASNGLRGFQVLRGSGNTYANSTVFGESDASIQLSDSDSNEFIDNEIYNSEDKGFWLIGSSKNNFTNNDVHNNQLSFLVESGSSKNTFLRNDVNESTRGFSVAGSQNNFSNNRVRDIFGPAAIQIIGASSNTFNSNNISTASIGISLESSNSNTFYNNNLQNCSVGAFNLISGSNTFVGNTLVNNNAGFKVNSTSSGNTFTSNTAFGNNDTFRIDSSGNSVIGNTIYDSKTAGIESRGANNEIKNNVVYRNVFGIHLAGTIDNVVSGNSAYENDYMGIVIDEGATGNTLSENIVYDNNPANLSLSGFFLFGGIVILDGSHDNIITKNNVYRNNQYGIGLFLPGLEGPSGLHGDTKNNIISLNNLTNNSGYGAFVDNSDNNKFSSNEVNNQRTGYGFYIKNSTGNVLENEHFYRNGNDFFINATRAVDIKLIKVVFDASEGKYENNTMLSINDTLKAIDSYSIKWATNTSTTKIPTGTFTLYKIVNMTTSYPYLEIDNVTWHWNDKDVQDADEKSIQLWSYTNAWNIMENFTLNTTTNSLNVSKVNASFYGLFYANATAADCRYVSISINFTPACDGNNVTVSAGGSPLSLANVTIIKEGNVIASGLTDATGKFSFNGTGQSADMYIEKTRTPDTCYSVPGAGKFVVNLKSPADCGRPECVVNSDCPSGQVCTSNKCTPSAAPECTKDTDCASGKVCQDGKCVEQQPPTGGCASDDNCTADQYCSAGSCTPVATGTCGHITNHAWVPYECCTNADCPEGQSCQDNKCTGGNYDLTGPSTGYVGDTVAFTAYQNSNPMANAQLKVTKPDGSFEMLTTDSSGTVSFQLTQPGNHFIYLLVNNKVVKTSALASASTTTTPEIPITLEVLVQIGLLIVFLLMVFGVLAFLAYYFFIGGKKATTRRKRRS